ncbi:RNA-splicing ligase RtcB [candidate division GN15 bacterium]|nr:RNA-splicing ligase RtcB [candidate division GN15 bacterium]
MAWYGPIKQLDDYRFQIEPSYQSDTMKRAGLSMRVPGVIYTNREMLDEITADNSPDQVAHVATLPGIVGSSFAMPDIHHGYGFAIGGVAAFDADEGIISPGGVGYDINCGVRLMRTTLQYQDIKRHVPKIIDRMFDNVPSGVGIGGARKLSMKEVDQVLTRGARWAVDEGYGWKSDPEFTEEGGALRDVDPSLVSQNAKKRGMPQLGTLGAGNHFLELQRVDAIYDTEAAAAYGITEVGQVTVMIHTGSRGCGHQICTDYLEVMRKANHTYHIPLADRELSCAPASSPEGRSYFAAMNCGANFAWANRQMIMHRVRQSFEQALGEKPERLGMHLLYDIAHNMAKLEEHEVDGKPRRVYVHRKGATRAFGPGHNAVPQAYRAVGQPVIIPGDMGSSSYLLAGTETAMRETFGSSCHGAGRRMSRRAATKRFKANEVQERMTAAGIYLRAASKRGISEEAPGVYKSVDDVIEVAHNSGIAKKVVRLRPIGVVKG